MKGIEKSDMMNFCRRYLMGSVVVALSLCAAQIIGNTLLIFAVLAAFIALVFWGCSQGITLPLLMFFLPWSPLLKPNPGSFSFYTFGLVIICAISAIKSWRHFQKYHIVLGVLLLLLTLLSKLIGGYGLAMDYICFMMMIVLFPILRTEEIEKKYSFHEATMFFGLGVVAASLCAQWSASFYNIAKYIRVFSYQMIVRRCGFYGDPNFYVAHITAALAGCLILILKRQRRGDRLVLGAMVMLLLYCGLLSGSKSFVLITGLILGLWLVELLKMRGQTRLKLAVLFCGILAAIYMMTSSMFSDLIDVLVTRFSAASNMDSFTTGRTELWMNYLDEFLGEVKVLFLGEGFTNVKLNGRASHNTILQMIYQLGIVGTLLIAGWSGYYFKTAQGKKDFGRNTIRKIVLLVGAFLPWMAIDALFFDEFFLMQWFCILGLQEIDKSSAVKRIEENG